MRLSAVVAPRLALLVTVFLASAGAQNRVPDLAQIIAEARTHPVAPQAEPPGWLEWSRVSRGLAFYAQHQDEIQQVLGTTSLVSTYAAVDITPVLMRTGRLARDYNQRLLETGQWIGVMLKTRQSREDFMRVNYRRATELGRMHLQIAQTVTAQQLGWNPAERVPMNQQAYAFVLYSFAWQPVEALLAMRVIDPAAHPAGLEDWFHLWSVLGYAMGVDSALLPRSYEQAALIVPKLRVAQYAASTGQRPDGIPVLLEGELGMLIATDPRAKSLSLEKARRLEAESLSQAIAISPGLGPALGLVSGDTQELLGFVHR